MRRDIGYRKDISTDSYRRPNRFIGMVFTAEMEEPWVFEYVDRDPASPSSVTSTGYIRTKVLQYDNVSDFATLRENVIKEARETAASYEYVTLKTAIMPHHEEREAVALQAEGVTGVYEETAWRIDRFVPGGWMEHSLRKAVYV